MPAAPILPAFPLPATLAVSAETRLAYVLRHFQLAFATGPAVSIGYAASQPAVVVAEQSGAFFGLGNPYPAAPNWREWEGQRIPFFFDTHPELPLLELGAGTARINADVVGAAFYLLSGWQEYYSPERDRHGRFPYAASVQQQYGFVALPVVNYYFDVLKTAVEHVSGLALQPRRWAGNAPFAAFISHDIDSLRSAWKAPAKAALRRGKLLAFGQQLWQHLTRPDAWNNLEHVAEAVACYGARSTFFVLPQQAKGADGTPNADYALTPALGQRFWALHEQGFEIAVHGSIGSALDTDQLKREKQALAACLPGVPVPVGLRFHYLRWDPARTLSEMEHLAVTYDSTLGFAEHYGFRHSYCHPFFPFNLATGRESTVLEIPLLVMDATLHHPHYLQLAPEEILPALTPMFQEVIRFGGVASVLWHNDHFDPTNAVTGPRQFALIMAYLQQHGAAFLTGRQIFAELCRE